MYLLPLSSAARENKWIGFRHDKKVPEASFEPEEDLCLSRRRACACGSSTLDGAADAGAPLGPGILWTPVADAPSSSSRLS